MQDPQSAVAPTTTSQRALISATTSSGIGTSRVKEPRLGPSEPSRNQLPDMIERPVPAGLTIPIQAPPAAAQSTVAVAATGANCPSSAASCATGSMTFNCAIFSAPFWLWVQIRLDKPLTVGSSCVRTQSRCEPSAVASHFVTGVGQQPFHFADQVVVHVPLLFQKGIDI